MEGRMLALVVAPYYQVRVSEKLEDRRIYPGREKIRYVHEHGRKEGYVVE